MQCWVWNNFGIPVKAPLKFSDRPEQNPIRCILKCITITYGAHILVAKSNLDYALGCSFKWICGWIALTDVLDIGVFEIVNSFCWFYTGCTGLQSTSHHKHIFIFGPILTGYSIHTACVNSTVMCSSIAENKLCYTAETQFERWTCCNVRFVDLMHFQSRFYVYRFV